MSLELSGCNETSSPILSRLDLPKLGLARESLRDIGLCALFRAQALTLDHGPGFRLLHIEFAGVESCNPCP